MVSTTCVLSVDQGTQSTRAYIFDSIDLKILGYNNVSIPQIYPQPGWVEQEPEVLWDSVVAAIQQVIEGCKTSNSLSIKALGIANQRETIVVWDKSTGKPLYNAIIWNDSRTVEICSWVQEKFGQNCFQDSTGLPISPYFSAYKLKWLQRNVKAVQEALKLGNCLFGTIDSWLCYKMTNGRRHCIEISNASRTSLMNLETERWDKNIITLLGLDDFVFPQIVSSAEEIGAVVSIPNLHGVKITGCLGDQQASLLGHRCYPGRIKNTYGTGSFLLLNTGETVIRSKHGLLSTVAYKLGKDANTCFALEGSISCAGQGVSWMRDSLKILDSNAESEMLAASVSDSDGVIFVPAFTGLLAPWWAPNARACIMGISLSTTKAHIVRALFSSICFQTKDVLEAVKSDSGVDEFECLFVDGGAATNSFLLQMQANALGIPVSRPNNTDTTALGAALAAGVGAKLWMPESLFEGNQMEFSQTFLPEKCMEGMALDYKSWKDAVKMVINHSDRISGETR